MHIQNTSETQVAGLSEVQVKSGGMLHRDYFLLGGFKRALWKVDLNSMLENEEGLQDDGRLSQAEQMHTVCVCGIQGLGVVFSKEQNAESLKSLADWVWTLFSRCW